MLVQGGKAVPTTKIIQNGSSLLGSKLRKKMPTASFLQVCKSLHKERYCLLRQDHETRPDCLQRQGKGSNWCSPHQ